MKTDVAIVGSGFAGTCAAHALAGRGFDVTLIDRRLEYPPLFRAEKIEPDQAAILRKLGLLEYRTPRLPPIGTTLNFDGEIVRSFDTVEQYGIDYCATVNALRSGLPGSIGVVTKPVSRVVEGKTPAVQFRDNTWLTARLIIMASGGSDALMKTLGVRRVRDSRLRSLTFGFDIVRSDREPFPFNGFNYDCHPRDSPHSIDYLTIFPIGARMRVNLFTQLLSKNALVTMFKRDPVGSLVSHFPGVQDHIGEFEVTSSVQVVPTSYYRVKRHVVTGVVLVGEEFQSVSPTTGMGLSKVLTDVDVLCNRYLPRWFDSGNFTRSEIRRYYSDPDKRAVDRKALEAWMFYHNRIMGFRVPLALRLQQRLRLLA